VSTRFTLPAVGAPSTVTFPAVSRATLDNGLRVWSVAQAAVPVVSCALVLEGGTSGDPADRPGLASLVASLATEGAGARDSIGMADALARLGAHLDVQAGADTTTFVLTTVSRHFADALALLSDVVRRPSLAAADFARVQDLRIGRLRQSSRVAATMADRAFVAAVFGAHPYGHGSLGTTRAVEAITLEEVQAFWRDTWAPSRAALLVASDLDAATVDAVASRVFGDWKGSAREQPGPAQGLSAPVSQPAGNVIAVHRPGAAQAELRVGHLGPARRTPDYHALVTLNAVLGGQFTSRINRNLREARAITYGARTAFDMRRHAGVFSCDTSVQADSAAIAVTEIVNEFRGVRAPDAIGADELEQARASLTRGYVRHFETVSQLVRALVELASYGLDADTFDRFVPAVSGLTPADLTRAADTSIRPDDCAVVVVTDLDAHAGALETLGRPVVVTEVEF
jgi:zinc protease